MKRHMFAACAAVALGTVGAASLGFAETPVPTEGPGFKKGAPGWYIEGTASDPLGPFPARGGAGGAPGGGGRRGAPPTSFTGVNTANVPPGSNGLSSDDLPPRCMHSLVCQDSNGTRLGGVTDGVLRVAWKPTTKW